jgi:shikimate dehydrogenase
MTAKVGHADRTLRLGLIGGNITESRSPALQIVCGLSVGRNVSYDLLIPKEREMTFAQLLHACEAGGYDGLNVTYPYKEEAVGLVPPGDPVVATLGAANTVRFGPKGPEAFNTDFSGFVSAYKAKWGNTEPGRVLVIGAGGVGRAIAFALAELGASAISLVDTEMEKAEALRAAVAPRLNGPVSIGNADGLARLEGFDGLVNCTPLGMAGRPGSPLPDDVRGKARWAFDAVYTPEHTHFRSQVEALGCAFLPGYELYFHQGIQAFRIFSGSEVTDHAWVRAVLRRGITAR